jgi:hypothetical protein
MGDMDGPRNCVHRARLLEPLIFCALPNTPLRAAAGHAALQWSKSTPFSREEWYVI